MWALDSLEFPSSFDSNKRGPRTIEYDISPDGQLIESEHAKKRKRAEAESDTEAPVVQNVGLRLLFVENEYFC